jgi:hypothetical protein
MRILPGGHFFLKNAPPKKFGTVIAKLLGVTIKMTIFKQHSKK